MPESVPPLSPTSTVPTESVVPEMMRSAALSVPREVIVNVPAPSRPGQEIGEAPTQIDPLFVKADPASEICTELVVPPNELM